MQSSESSPARAVDAMPEAFVSTRAISREVSRRVKAGRLRKLASRLYTSDLQSAPELIVRRNLWDIVAGYFPGAVLADRTAFEIAPAADGSVCLVTERGGDIVLPGARLRPRRGPRLPSDRPFLNRLFLSSTARSYLDNLSVSRARGGLLPRTLSRRDIEERLDDLFRRAGQGGANRLRDEARDIAPLLGRERERRALDALIGALAGTGQAPLASTSARARQAGAPVDRARLQLFQTLHAALRDVPSQPRSAPHRTFRQTAALSFYDAYFSNFIEGTEFAVDEAARIVFDGHMPAERPRDAHDIMGVWRIVSDAAELRRVPDTSEEFMDILRVRHGSILAGRPDMRPGEFKSVPNQVGATLFVLPEDVPGTLAQAFLLRESLETAFQRAAYMLFLVSEVHPFADGNGRIARIMMNAELASSGEERIIIPTAYRGSYLSALRALTHNGATEPLIRMLDFAQRWTLAVDWQDVQATASLLDTCNAFLRAEEAEDEGRRLRMP